MRRLALGATSKMSLVVVLLAVAALIIGVYSAQRNQAPTFNPEDFNGTVLAQPRDLSAFKLVDHNNQVFDNDSLKGQWNLVFFGFTHCPHVCPTAMNNLSKTYNMLKEQQVSPLPQIILVSVDPDRDTAEKMGEYVAMFDKDFVGVTGDMGEINGLTSEIGIAHMKITTPETEITGNYDIEHSGAIMLFNPQGQLAGFFTSPHDPVDIAQDMTNLNAIA